MVLREGGVHTKWDGLTFGLINCKESRLVLAVHKRAEDGVCYCRRAVSEMADGTMKVSPPLTGPKRNGQLAGAHQIVKIEREWI